MAPEEVPPELQALLTGMEGFQARRHRLPAAAVVGRRARPDVVNSLDAAPPRLHFTAAYYRPQPLQEAAVGLAAAEQELGAPPDLRIPGNVMDEWSTAANAHTGLWRGLARVLEAGHAALLAGTYMVGPELQMALNKHLLFVSAPGL